MIASAMPMSVARSTSLPLPLNDLQVAVCCGGAVGRAPVLEDSLHHLIKWEGSLESIERVLKPGAKAMFCENFARDPIMRMLRPLNWWVKGYVGEHSLDEADLARLREVFGEVKITDRSFFYTYSRLLAKATPRNRKLSRFLRAVDEKWLPRSRWLRSHYSLAILELIKAPGERGARVDS